MFEKEKIALANEIIEYLLDDNTIDFDLVDSLIISVKLLLEMNSDYISSELNEIDNIALYQIKNILSLLDVVRENIDLLDTLENNFDLK